MYSLVVVLLLSILTSVSFAQANKEEEFQELLDEVQLQFVMPDNYIAVPTIENRQLYYSYAIKDTSAQLEVRYSIWSLKPVIEDYERCLKDTGCTMVPPNRIYPGLIRANILNQTQGEDFDFQYFPDAAVKKEFNADKGGSAFFPLRAEFGKGYEWCMMIVIHRENIGQAVISILGQSSDQIRSKMMEVFYSMKFK